MQPKHQSLPSFLFLLFFVVATHSPALYAQEGSYPLVRWLKSNFTHHSLPRSFSILPVNKNTVWQAIGGINNTDSTLERIIVQEGLVIYDGAVAQIALTNYGLLDSVFRVFKIYWDGSFGEFQTIRAGYNGTAAQPFIYDTANPTSVSADLALKGQRGFIFKLINAEGKYTTADPWDSSPAIWMDWKPISGENAWVVIAAAHYLDKKFYNPVTGAYSIPDTSSVLNLAKEIARCALMLQADNGGIRMAPQGTYHPSGNKFLYNEISTENNASWGAAFSLLYRITGETKYKEARDKIASYVRWVYDNSTSVFAQGAHFDGTRWHKNSGFALDCQSWVLLSFSPDSVDQWLGSGTAYRVLQNGIMRAGSTSNGTLKGVGYCDEHDQVSVEWTAGAILSSRALARFYRLKQPAYAAKCSTDAFLMTRGIESDSQGLQTVIGDQTAYSYSLIRKFIPFGWWAHHKYVLSTASTGWMIFVKDTLNPFAFFHGSDPVRISLNPGIDPVSMAPNRLVFKDGILTCFLPEKTGLRISIHDIAGRVVYTINSGIKADGWRSYKLPLHRLSKGVYVCTLKTGGFQSSVLFHFF